MAADALARDLGRAHARAIGAAYPIPPDYYGAGLQPAPAAAYYQPYYIRPIASTVPATAGSIALDPRMANYVDPGTVETPAAVLGSNIALEYDPARGVTTAAGKATRWLCQRTAHALIAPTAAPAIALTEEDFNAAPSIAMTLTGNDGLRSESVSGTDLLPAGARPYAAWLGRLFPSTASPCDFVFCLCSTGGTQDFAVYRQSPSPFSLRLSIGGTVLSAMDYAPSVGTHLYEWVWVGTALELWVDFVLVASTTTALTVAAAVRRVSIGQTIDDLLRVTGKHGYLLVATTALTFNMRERMLPFWRMRGAPV